MKFKILFTINIDMATKICSINRLDAHDRLEHLKKEQSVNIFQGAEDCLKTNPDSLGLQEYSPYIYIFAHPRTSEDGYSKRLIWQPRLTKPRPQENSYLFRAISKSDILEIFWIIPPIEHWGQYKKGNVTESDIVCWSIHQFQNNREKMGEPEQEDLTDAQSAAAWRMHLQSTKSDKKILDISVVA